MLTIVLLVRVPRCPDEQRRQEQQRAYRSPTSMGSGAHSESWEGRARQLECITSIQAKEGDRYHSTLTTVGRARWWTRGAKGGRWRSRKDLCGPRWACSRAALSALVGQHAHEQDRSDVTIRA